VGLAPVDCHFNVTVHSRTLFPPDL
jgi:hypothetical protein